MKCLLCAIGLIVFAGAKGQSIVGTWQQEENKTCFESQLPESQTEKELLPSMGSNSKTGVAKLITFDAKGRGEEAIFSQGEKKGSNKNSFKYQLIGQDLQILDKKSGIMTQHFIIDELTESSLKIHDAKKDCETRSFSRVK